MSAQEEQQFYNPELSAAEKFNVISPYWDRIHLTGYARALTITFQKLYGVQSFSLKTVEELAYRYHEIKKPGFYEQILKGVCRISECHVHSVERIFMETANPALLKQDISIMELTRCTLTDIRRVEAELGLKIDSFDDWLNAIDCYFDRFGRQAVAVKYQGAYYRALRFARVERHVAEKQFKTLTAGRPYIGPDGARSLEDYLFHYCLRKANEYSLPVKIHTGYCAGNDSMPLARVRDNAVDVCRLLEDYPSVRFVLMHIGYPYQDEYIALCKQFSNAYVDLCWAWIINPAACVRFLSEFLMAVPANKVLTFGGDYIAVENVVGHAAIARSGLTEVLSGLVGRGWIERENVAELVERLMLRNAAELFDR